MSVELIPVDRQDDVVDVFADAFQGYPVMRCTVGPGGDVDARERRLVRLFVTRRTRRGGPMYGIAETGSGFAGAILLTLPTEPEPPPDVAEISAQAWRELGEDARRRYDAYTAASNFFAGYEPHLHLNMIGVRRVHKGSGLGRRLLEKVREMYRHFGYEVVGHAKVGPFDFAQDKARDSAQGGPFDAAQGKPAFETWGMYLRIR